MSYYGFRPYVPVAKRRAIAVREVEKLKKKGRTISPVVIEGRTIVRTFWGKAWCENLERYSDYENRPPRGRTYVRNGAIVDLQIGRGQVQAMVSGSELYSVKIEIDTISKARWAEICMDCLGSVGSLVELLQGKLSKNVMERVCRKGDGLFPSPREIEMKCSCLDWAGMCKHASAVLYGVGARFDAEPDFLFALRGVDRSELIAGAGADLPMTQTEVAAERVLVADDVAALFGIEMDPTPSKSGIAVTGMSAQSGTSEKARRATSNSRRPANEAVSLHKDSPKAKPVQKHSKNAKASPVSNGGRHQPTDTNADGVESRVAQRKAKSATQPIRSFAKAPKEETVAVEPIAPRCRIPKIAAKWTKWKKQKAR